MLKKTKLLAVRLGEQMMERKGKSDDRKQLKLSSVFIITVTV